MNKNLLILNGLLLLLLHGCAHSAMEELSSLPEEFKNAPLTIDSFSARAFLGGSDYERYYYTEGKLWRECGQVTSSYLDQPQPKVVEGDKVFPEDPSLSITKRRVEKISTEEELRLKARAAALVIAEATGEGKEPPPGSVFSLSEPGVLELNVSFGSKKVKLITSVDAVADKETPALQQANVLLSYMRGLGPIICDAETFYGIARSKK